MELRRRVDAFLLELQDDLCRALERVDGQERFREDRWQRASGGGGVTRVISGGAVFEKGGVNLSSLRGELGPSIAQRLQVEPRPFFASGVSLVLHPESPLVPTVHMNVRYLELPAHGSAGARAWFGGGADLTPHYLFEEDAVHFHRCLQRACDRHAAGDYSRFKQWCDDYFRLTHRDEGRGVGGIFFDYLADDLEQAFALVQEVGRAFGEAYLPIVERRASLPWTPRHRAWQSLRRGRYVEFNLIYDRGTLFGLETGGRTESILISLPPQARWVYDHRPEPGSAEAALIDVLRRPVDWAARG